MIFVLVILACAALNRARGDDRWMMGRLPGRALYYVAPAIGFLAWDWRFALAYLVWGIPSWGHWFDLGRMPPLDRKPDPVGRVIESVSFGSDHLAMLWRHALAVPLLGWMAGPWALLCPLAVVAVYEAAWRVRPSNPIIVAELLTGAVWGLFAVLSFPAR